MAVEEPRRIALFERLRGVIGREDAVTMLELLPPSGQDVLTREDLRREMDGLRREMTSELEEVVRRDDLREELSHYATKADIYRIFTIQTLALAAVLGAAAAFFG